MENTHPNKFYYRCYKYIGPLLRFVRPILVIGRENMLEGAALVCANHSAMIDPFHIALSFPAEMPVHVLAKVELFKIPFISWLLRKLKMISVDRSTADGESIKASLKYLRDGEKVVIFPEGTRLSENDALAAKRGAVKIAERAGVPIIPVFLPRKKPAFRKSPVVFGKPYLIEKTSKKRTPEDYDELSTALMSKILALEPKS